MKLQTTFRKIRLVAILLIVGFATNAKAQTSVDINGGAENWTMGSFAGVTYDSLICWDTPQRLAVALAVPDTVTFRETTFVNSGSSAVRMVTREISIGGVLEIMVPGTMSTGNYFIDIFGGEFGVTGGKPIDCTPFAFSGVAAYFPIGADTASVSILLFAGSDTIGGGTIDILASAGVSYLPFTVPIVNFSPFTPTSIQITILSSKSIGNAGSVLYVDDFELLCPGVCETPANLTAVPASTTVDLSWSPVDGATSYKVYGRIAGSSTENRRIFTDTAKRVKNLLPATNYEWTIHARCDGELSPLAPVQSFTTLAARFSEDLEIYPNPASNLLNFKVDVEKETVASLYSIVGLEVRKIIVGAGETVCQMNIEDLPAGQYLLQIGEGELAKSALIEVRK